MQISYLLQNYAEETWSVITQAYNFEIKFIHS